MNPKELKQKKQELTNKSTKKMIADSAYKIYENNINDNDLYKHQKWDNSSVFVVDVLEKVFDVKLSKLREKADYCPSFFRGFEEIARQESFEIKKCNNVNIGDIVFIGFNPFGYSEHCGIAVNVCRDLVTTIEWDTSHNFDINGGKLMKKIRHRSLITEIWEICKI